MTNPIKRMIINHRRLKVPPCSTCAKCIATISGIRCKAPKYCDRKNRLNCTNVFDCSARKRTWHSVLRVRGAQRC